MNKLKMQRDDPALRFLFYSHDGMGLGHTRRNLAIAAALSELCPFASILLATGTDEAHRLGLPPRVEILKLPGLRKTGNDQYQSRRLDVPVEDIRQLRSSLLEAAIKTFHPDVVLVEKHPFGARGELRAGLARLKAQGGRAVLGWRDILDDALRTRRELAANCLVERIADYYDRLLIYGMRSVFDPIAEYDLPDSLAQRTRFCGYVLNHDLQAFTESNRPPQLPKSTSRPTVLATAGGGEDGFFLLNRFLRATTGAPWHGTVIAGPLMPSSGQLALHALAARAHVSLDTFVPRLPAIFHQVNALVCMGGYNTLTEAVAHGVPTICVPRVQPRSEQLIRALAFERLGLIRVIHPKDLAVTTLRDEIRATLGSSRDELSLRVQETLQLNGAGRAAEELLAIARADAPVPELAIPLDH